MAIKLTYTDGQESQYGDDTEWEVDAGVLKLGRKKDEWSVLLSPSHWAVIEVGGSKKSDDGPKNDSDDEKSDGKAKKDDDDKSAKSGEKDEKDAKPDTDGDDEKDSKAKADDEKDDDEDSD